MAIHPPPAVLVAVAALAVAASLSGCLGAAAPAAEPASLGDGGAGAAAGQPAPTGATEALFSWAGDIKADPCLDHAGGCGLALDKPQHHQRHFNVDLAPAPHHGAVTLSWEVRSGTPPTLRLWLVCQDQSPSCEGGREGLSAQGSQSPLRLEPDLSWMAASDRLSVMVGVVPEATPAGDVYAAVDVGFGVEARFAVRG